MVEPFDDMARFIVRVIAITLFDLEDNMHHAIQPYMIVCYCNSTLTDHNV